MSDITRCQFLELLRAGLWVDYTPNLDVFSGSVDWCMIYNLAKEQTVSAVVWDGVLKLPSELYPPKCLKMKWISLVMTIEKLNLHHNRVIAELMTLYKDKGVDVVLMKGQSMAVNYPNPLRRVCGDIDIYVGKDGYAKVEKIINELGIKWHLEGSKHKNFEFKGVEIENHSRFVNEYMPKERKRMEANLNRWYPNAPEFMVINSVSVAIPPTDFNVMYVFSHMFNHFLTSGVGLRQVIDWMLMLSKYNINVADDYSDIMAWRVFGYIAVNYLGLSKDRVPNYDESVDVQAKRCLEMIFADGNFGKNHSEEVFGRRPKNFYIGKLYAFRYRLRRLANISKVIPYSMLFSKLVNGIAGSVRLIIKTKF